MPNMSQCFLHLCNESGFNMGKNKLLANPEESHYLCHEFLGEQLTTRVSSQWIGTCMQASDPL